MALLKYVLARLLLFAVVTGVLYLAGMRSFLLIAVALVMTAALAFLVLKPLSDDMFRTVDRWRDEKPLSKAGEADAADEDAILDDAEHDPTSR